MNIYIVEDNNEAKKFCQLLKLNAECAKLHWSRTITDLPSEVVDALSTIENYIENQIAEICKIDELTDLEENEMLSFIRKNSALKESLGTGVVMSDQAKDVLEMIGENAKLKKIKSAIESGNNIVIF